LAWLAAETFTAGLRRSDAGADALLDKFALELSDPGQNRGHHSAMRGGEIERHPV
jgi:hypothetical protein